MLNNFLPKFVPHNALFLALKSPTLIGLITLNMRVIGNVTEISCLLAYRGRDRNGRKRKVMTNGSHLVNISKSLALTLFRNRFYC